MIQTSLKELRKAHEQKWTLDPVKDGAQLVKTDFIEEISSIQNDESAVLAVYGLNEVIYGARMPHGSGLSFKSHHQPGDQMSPQLEIGNIKMYSLKVPGQPA